MSLDLSTSYLGLKLKNPIIIGASGLTDNIKSIIELEKHGAAAIVLKSLFEEQIMMDIDKQRMNNIFDAYSDAENYIGFYAKEHAVSSYLKLISDAKEQTNIPVIASINCNTTGEWTSFAKKMEDAGANAIELNVFILPSDKNISGTEIEKRYFDIIESVKSAVNIPISLKISHYFSGLANFAHSLSNTGINGLVLFNKFFTPNIDIKTKKLVTGNIYSQTSDNAMTLRWTGILANKIKCDIAANTGIHNGETVIKNLMAGAKATEIVSAIYNNGASEIATILNEMESLMQENNYSSISEIIGVTSQNDSTNSMMYERAQFMKYFSSNEF